MAFIVAFELNNRDTKMILKKYCFELEIGGHLCSSYCIGSIIVVVIS